MRKGLLIGLFSPVIGFFIYGFGWSVKYNRTLEYFIIDLFLRTTTYQAPVISLSLLINLIPFFYFLRKEDYQSARGVLLAVFLYVPVIVYFKYLA